MKKILLATLALLFLLMHQGLLPVGAKADLRPASYTVSDFLQMQPVCCKEKSGIYILEKGEESLLVRGWLADHAVNTIDVQYFIWSSDNIGILAAESLLRAAERGVKIRVIVDDLLVDAADQIILALQRHPNITIKIYNPKHSVGVSLFRRIINILSDFRAANQRMHDKTFLVDGQVAITGGRNMADEYYDFNHTYNFRDRDVLLLGPVVAGMSSSFSRFWQSELAMDVDELLHSSQQPDEKTVARVYQELHDYAADPENLEPQIRQELVNLPEFFPLLVKNLRWEEVEFLADMPGKNDSNTLGGGGATTGRLVEVVQSARKSIVIQSPYLVMPDGAIELFTRLVNSGVRVRINTNSLASTDNLQAFSGYSKQRKKLLEAGIEVYEYKPAPAIQRDLINRYEALAKNAPTFAIHAKTMIVDSRHLYVGTFNLDPRSTNLNTEVGILVESEELAHQVESAIELDMQPDNSWEAATQPDRHAPISKRAKVFFWKLLPLEPLL